MVMALTIKLIGVSYLIVSHHPILRIGAYDDSTMVKKNVILRDFTVIGDTKRYIGKCGDVMMI